MAILNRPYVFISESDMEDERIQLILKRVGLHEFLYMCGFDKDKFITDDSFFEASTSQHRNRAGKIVECMRYVGFERLDAEWIKSGNATLEAEIASKKDKSLTKMLNWEVIDDRTKFTD